MQAVQETENKVEVASPLSESQDGTDTPYKIKLSKSLQNTLPSVKDFSENFINTGDMFFLFAGQTIEPVQRHAGYSSTAQEALQHRKLLNLHRSH